MAAVILFHVTLVPVYYSVIKSGRLRLFDIPRRSRLGSSRLYPLIYTIF